ncbi:MAG: hypothetical protein IJ549_06290 [Prevotella sp.]|nr:hypothetical protein [Prevotella sp.]
MKAIKSIFAIATIMMAFASCSDVPEPYTLPGNEEKPVIEAQGSGTLDDPYNSIAANNIASELSSGQASTESYYIKGKVASIKYNYGEGNYPASADFYISDDGSKNGQFYVYGCKYLGNTSYSSGTVLQVGDDVVIYGQLYNYNGTPETATNKAFLYSLNGVSEGGVDDNPVTPDTPDLSGKNLLENGDFETWDGGLPTNWKTASTAGNATVTQSTDAHGGSYSAAIGFNTTSNKRLGYKEITLKPGTYTFAVYAKSTTTDVSQTEIGYVPVNNGTADSQGYKYGGYVSLNNNSWTQVTSTFTLDAQKTVCLVIMNPKTNGSYSVAQEILVDDAVLVTNDGGIVEGGETTPDTPDTPVTVTTISVADFLAAAESTTEWYQLTGTISHLEDGTYKNSTTYGNFDLTDESGTVYVYGVVSEKGGAKAKFADLMKEKGIKDGSKITIIGNRGSYSGKPEVTNAYFVSVE